MAFARIITRSHQYAEKLALDLLARGYAVEIVSPDAIPESPADLELRVESGESFGQLTPETRQPKTAEYVQRLKPMMADLLRKWPASKNPAEHERSAGFGFDAEPEPPADIETPSAHFMNEVAEIPPEVKGVEFHESAKLVPAAPSSKTELSAFSITGEPLSWSESESEGSFRSDIWFWRAAVGFAGVAVIILVFGMALRKPPAAVSASANATPSETAKVVATPSSTMAPSVSTISTPTTVASITPKPAVIPVAVSDSTVNKAKPSAALRAGVRSTTRTNSNEVVRGDTTITYFKGKQQEAAKPIAKQESGIKHYSDLD